MLGYAAMNRTLRDRDPPLRCNRRMRKQTCESRGLPYASELILEVDGKERAVFRARDDWSMPGDVTLPPGS